MNGGIYLIRDNGQLVEMTEQAYDSEDLLQELLVKYPSLLAGNQMNSSAPRRWLLISREISLPSEEDSAGRWSVDHLFLDQDATPTLVKVKRSSDTRIRREVVGQMLDYAANAVVYWPIEKIRARFETNCENRGSDSEEELNKFLGPDADQEQFWQTVKTNLNAGKIRLIFVADEIPSELQRIVEFLNEQMDSVEVLAVEIKQYVSKKRKALVPRLFGHTGKAQQKKSGVTGKKWNESSFFHDLEERRGVDEATVARKILDWGKTNKLRIWWGKGLRFGAFATTLDYKGEAYWPFVIWTYGRVEIQFQWLKIRPPFDDESKQLEFLNRLNEISGIDIPKDAITKRPSFPISLLKDDVNLEKFLKTLDWFLQEVKAY
ncbi:MAG: hypothetical protein ACE5HW_01560 [Candidatus Methanofastidiosia archaeon]